jgi:hypothetical protein
MLKSGKIIAFILLAFVITTSYSCKKAVDKAQENAINDIITNGRWEVTKFDVASTPKLSEYNGYAFQFFSNGVVTATKSGSPDINGTWQSNISNITITSNFPVNVGPLQRFNGLWVITRFTETTVQATKSEGAEEFLLGLRRIM